MHKTFQRPMIGNKIDIYLHKRSIYYLPISQNNFYNISRISMPILEFSRYNVREILILSVFVVKKPIDLRSKLTLLPIFFSLKKSRAIFVAVSHSRENRVSLTIEIQAIAKFCWASEILKY